MIHLVRCCVRIWKLLSKMRQGREIRLKEKAWLNELWLWGSQFLFPTTHPLPAVIFSFPPLPLSLEVKTAFRQVLICGCLLLPLGHWNICLTAIEIKGYAPKEGIPVSGTGDWGNFSTRRALQLLLKPPPSLPCDPPPSSHGRCKRSPSCSCPSPPWYLQSVNYKGPSAFKGLKVTNKIYNKNHRLLSTTNQSPCFF